MTINIIFTIIGFVLLIKGADLLVDGASYIAKKFNIPEIVIGLTIVSIGTSMPELVVSLTSAVEGYSDIALGNVIGSNITNMFLILGLCAVIRPLTFKKETRLIENPITLVITIVFFIVCLFGLGYQQITQTEGVILLVLCVGFIIYNIIMAKEGEEFDKEEGIELSPEPKLKGKKRKILKALIYLALGITALKFGGDLVVNNTVRIAGILGISEKIISLTIVAFSTSLPELITSVTATRKGDTDMAIGNILGSQIFNIVLIIGLASFIYPINYSTEYNKEIILLVLGTIMLGLYPFIGKKNTMTRTNGAIFLSIYFTYMINIVLTNI